MRHIAQQPNIRDLILDGVELQLARFGYRKMTMADLASQVGIGKGTLYLHFPGKQELALAHIDRLVERLLQALRAIAATNASPSARLEAMLRTRVLHRFDSDNAFDFQPFSSGPTQGALNPGQMGARTYDELRGRGVEFVAPPKKEPWGTFAIFKDIDGNQFVLSPK